MYKPKITISWYLHELVSRLHYDARWKEKEWSGYLRLIKNPNADGWLAVDIYFPQQVNSKAHTEITEAGKAKFVDWVVDRDPAEAGEWFCWIHSHNSMKAFWSGEDQDTRDKFYLNGAKSYLSIVTATGGGINMHDSMRGPVYYNGTFDIFHPGRAEFDCEILVEELPEPQGIDEIDAEIDVKAQEVVERFSYVDKVPKVDIVSFLKGLFNTGEDMGDIEFNRNNDMRDKELLKLEELREQKITNLYNTTYSGYIPYGSTQPILFLTKICELSGSEISGYGGKKGKKGKGQGGYQTYQNGGSLAPITYNGYNNDRGNNNGKRKLEDPIEEDDIEFGDILPDERGETDWAGDYDDSSNIVTWVDVLEVGNIVEELDTGIKFSVTGTYSTTVTIKNLGTLVIRHVFRDDLFNNYDIVYAID